MWTFASEHLGQVEYKYARQIRHSVQLYAVTGGRLKLAGCLPVAAGGGHGRGMYNSRVGYPYKICFYKPSAK